MECREMAPHLVGLADGELAGPAAAAVRAHVEGCPRCRREVARHRQAWRLLGGIDAGEAPLGRERLQRMADAALREASRPAPVLARPRRLVHLAAAAAVVLAVTIGARMAMRRVPAAPPLLPAFLDDPEFVKNFDVIRDLSDLDADGVLFDVDDDVLILQALEGA